jgi:hypothetical protein
MIGSAADLSDAERFARALARFDAANAEDPHREREGGRESPKELLYAERLTAMLARFAPDASAALRFAAPCQHIRRWKIPRNEYPMTRGVPALAHAPSRLPRRLGGREAVLKLISPPPALLPLIRKAMAEAS